MPEVFGFDTYSPKEIAEKVETIGVTKARLPLISMVVLGVLAGGFIGLGGLYFNLVTSDPNVSFALSRVLGGLVFSLGLLLVVVAGGELFTGNNLLVMAWVSHKISFKELLRNWVIIFLSNLVGALGLVLLVYLSQHWRMNANGVGIHAVKIAVSKVTLPFWPAFFKGVLCNLLVCLAVWISLAGRTLTDKMFAIIFPISAFVAAGFEHSIANLYFIPLGLFLKTELPVQEIPHIEELNWVGFFNNLIPVTMGNIVGGSLLVALVYYLVYRRPKQ